MGKRVNEAERFRKVLPKEVVKLCVLRVVRLCQGTNKKLIYIEGELAAWSMEKNETLAHVQVSAIFLNLVVAI